MIAVVDYLAGNLTSVKKALDQVGADSVVTRDPSVIAQADKIILPGVGHFSSIALPGQAALRQTILQRVAGGVQFLGICVGMQWMFDASEEAPGASGLGWFREKCVRFPACVKSPHVGWNSLTVAATSRLLRGVPSGSYVYFTHSYRVPVNEATAARSEYGGEFSAAVERDHLFGVQFHPEKSGSMGLKVLENFGRMESEPSKTPGMGC